MKIIVMSLIFVIVIIGLYLIFDHIYFDIFKYNTYSLSKHSTLEEDKLIGTKDLYAKFIKGTQILNSDFTPDKCIDGNRFTSCHSYIKKKPAIEISLKDMKLIKKIILYNRSDCCKEKLVPFILTVLDENKNETYKEGRYDVADQYIFNINQYGKYVQIQINKLTEEILHFGDIDIFY
jgi:hypothetical protein